MQHYVIKFISDLPQLWVFSPDAPGSSNKTDHNITEILLKVVLNTITLPSLHLRLLIDVFAQLPNSSMVISSGTNILATVVSC
jgi:hypothetical protein